MKLHSTLNVELTYQNFGSAWLGVLRGTTEAINQAFNGLYNFCATNGECQFQDHAQCIATFWTDRKAMRRYFFNRYNIQRYVGRDDINNGKLARASMRYAHEQMNLLTGKCHEPYLNFDKQGKDVDLYSCGGKISAERPDTDMKDAILLHAFAIQESAPDTKVVDND